MKMKRMAPARRKPRCRWRSANGRQPGCVHERPAARHVPSRASDTPLRARHAAIHTGFFRKNSHVYELDASLLDKPPPPNFNVASMNAVWRPSEKTAIFVSHQPVSTSNIDLGGWGGSEGIWFSKYNLAVFSEEPGTFGAGGACEDCKGTLLQPFGTTKTFSGTGTGQEMAEVRQQAC